MARQLHDEALRTRGIAVWIVMDDWVAYPGKLMTRLATMGTTPYIMLADILYHARNRALSGWSYAVALRWAEEALRENCGMPALRLKLSLCGHLGLVEEAAQCVRRFKESDVEPSVPYLMSALGKGAAPAPVAHFAEGLRKAGVPEYLIA